MQGCLDWVGLRACGGAVFVVSVGVERPSLKEHGSGFESWTVQK